jgi:hypothetical protein
MKSEIVNQIRRIGRTSPESLEQSVFETLVGHRREEVDWDNEGNQAGYYTWVKAFDSLVGELIEDGYIVTEDPNILAATEADPVSEYSHLAYPTRA